MDMSTSKLVVSLFGAALLSSGSVVAAQHFHAALSDVSFREQEQIQGLLKNLVTQADLESLTTERDRLTTQLAATTRGLHERMNELARVNRKLPGLRGFITILISLLSQYDFDLSKLDGHLSRLGIERPSFLPDRQRLPSPKHVDAVVAHKERADSYQVHIEVLVAALAAVRSRAPAFSSSAPAFNPGASTFSPAITTFTPGAATFQPSGAATPSKQEVVSTPSAAPTPRSNCKTSAAKGSGALR
jgi:hypothetical protein